MTSRPLAAACILALAGCGGSSGARPGGGARAAADGAVRHAAPRLRLVRVARLEQPVLVTQPPGDLRRLFVVERTGRVRVIRGGRTLHRAFLSVRGHVSLQTEQGLLGLAFAPDFVRSRRLYYSYTDHRGALRVVEARAARRVPERIDRSSRRLVLRIPMPAPTHHGGNLAFGPDGLLYLGIGDGGGAGDPRRKAQNRASLLGKILRIDPRATTRRRYRSPPSNPFTRLRGARDEIFAYGLRNPWRFSFDPLTGGLYIGDVGQETWEEIDAVPLRRARGANFGWSAWEGRHRFNRRLRAPRHVMPIHDYAHPDGCSVIAGYVVRDPALAHWRGRFLYGDFCSGKISSLRAAGRHARGVRSEHLTVPALSSFGQDRRGRIYVTSLRGAIFRLAGPR